MLLLVYVVYIPVLVCEAGWVHIPSVGSRLSSNNVVTSGRCMSYVTTSCVSFAGEPIGAKYIGAGLSTVSSLKLN